MFPGAPTAQCVTHSEGTQRLAVAGNDVSDRSFILQMLITVDH